jgi:predicted ABC-type ATPase
MRGLIFATASPPFSRKNPQELVIFCGSPGAGKSTFYWDYLEPLGYERVNQDTLKTVRLSPCTRSMKGTRKMLT